MGHPLSTTKTCMKHAPHQRLFSSEFTSYSQPKTILLRCKSIVVGWTYELKLWKSLLLALGKQTWVTSPTRTHEYAWQHDKQSPLSLHMMTYIWKQKLLWLWQWKRQNDSDRGPVKETVTLKTFFSSHINSYVQPKTILLYCKSIVFSWTYEVICEEKKVLSSSCGR